MRRARFKITEKGVDAIYHCMSRTVNGEGLFETADQEQLRKMLWQVADFSGVQLLTYCLMDNHFHVLVAVPYEETVSDRELLRRYRVLYPKPTAFQPARVEVLEKVLAQNGSEAVKLRAQLLARMGDVSEFMKTLKQRFTTWYNHRHERFGPLWAERFKSVLVQGGGNPLQTMAAYIDLNPVRAGIVEDPKDYRFCGYAEAVAGQKNAQEGLLRVWKAFGAGSRDAALAAHRMLLFGKGSLPGKSGKGAAVDAGKARQVLQAEQGELPTSELLRCRLRFFSDGAVIGSGEFVAALVKQWQAHQKRKYPPKPQLVKSSEGEPVVAMRRVRQSS